MGWIKTQKVDCYSFHNKISDTIRYANRYFYAIGVEIKGGELKALNSKICNMYLLFNVLKNS